jgi:hypothetical protein
MLLAAKGSKINLAGVGVCRSTCLADKRVNETLVVEALELVQSLTWRGKSASRTESASYPDDGLHATPHRPLRSDFSTTPNIVKKD